MENLRIPKLLPEQILNAQLDLDKPKSLFTTSIQQMSLAMTHDRKVLSLIDFGKIKNLDVRLAAQTLIEDAPTKAIALMHAHWQAGDKNLYRVSPDFFKVFSTVSFKDIHTDALPTNLCGFCQLPEEMTDEQGDKFDGFYFFSGPGRFYLGGQQHWHKSILGITSDKVVVGDDTNILGFGWYDKTGNCNFAVMPFNGNETLQDIFSNSEFVIKDTFLTRKQKVILEDGFLPHLRVMTNLLIYLNSGNPDLREFRNTIKYQSPTSQTPVRKDKELTLLPITLVGFGYKKSPMYEKDFWEQPPYWGHRRYGPGRTLRRYMLIKGSIKQRKAGKVEAQAEVTQ